MTFCQFGRILRRALDGPGVGGVMESILTFFSDYNDHIKAKMPAPLVKIFLAKVTFVKSCSRVQIVTKFLPNILIFLS